MKKARRMLAFMLALSLTAVSSLSVWGESTDTETAGEETYQENSDAGSIESAGFESDEFESASGATVEGTSISIDSGNVTELESLDPADALEEQSPSALQSVHADGSLTATPIEGTEGDCKIILSGVSNTASIHNVAFEVWSSVGGKTAAKWYDAPLQDDGSFAGIVPVSDQKAYGTYYVNSYAALNDGGLVQLASGQFDVAAPTITPEILSGEDGKCRLTLANVLNIDLINNVAFRVWSAENGAEHWYDAPAGQANDFVAEIALTNHNAYGTYYVEAYIKLKDGTLLMPSNCNFEVPTPSMSSPVEVTPSSEKEGTYLVSMEGISVPGGIKSLAVELVSKDGKAIDKWVDAYQSGDGYRAAFKKSDYKSQSGNYTATVFVLDRFGLLWNLGSKDFTIEAASSGSSAKSEPKIEPKKISGESGSYELMLTGLDESIDVNNVAFQVISEATGASRWYDAPLQANDSYVGSFSIKDFGSYGTYYVNAYVKQKDGTLIMPCTATFDVKTPTISNISCKATETDGTYQVKIEGLESEWGVKSLAIHLFSENGVDKWLDAYADGSDYACTLKPADYNNLLGNYSVKVYLLDECGILSSPGDSCNFTIGLSYDSFTSDGSTIVMTGLANDSAINNMAFRIYSEVEAQKDVWYDAWKQSDGSYLSKINLSDFIYAGKYNVDCYVRLKNGQLLNLGSTDFELEEAAISNHAYYVDPDTGDYTIIINGVEASYGIKGVHLEVWCRDDRSDLVTYTPKSGTTGYIVNGNISLHNYATGNYHIKVVVTGENGLITESLLENMEISFDGGTFIGPAVSENGLVYTISFENVHMLDAVDAIAITVSNEENGANDEKWYDVTKDGNTLTSDVIITHHLGKGNCNISLYVKTKGGELLIINTASFSLLGLPESSVSIDSVNGNTGEMEISGTLVEVPANISSVAFEVWCEDAEGSTHWYDAYLSTDGTYTATANAKNHAFKFGNYHVVGYYKDISGNLYTFGSDEAAFEADNLIVGEQISSAVYMFTIYGANANGVTADTVYFPTWSFEDDQDDLVWYTGDSIGDGCFTVKIYRNNHNHDGDYYTHIYVSAGGSAVQMVGMKQYQMYSPTSYDSYAQSVMRKIIYAVETGGQVYGNARYNDFTQAFTNSSNEKAITIGAGQWYATEAKRLLNLIREWYPSTFAAYDTAGIAWDLDNLSWSTYGGEGGVVTIYKGSAKAVAIQNIINTDEGRSVQDYLIDEQMSQYISEATALGVTDLKARMFLANVRHLGGYGPMKWVVECCISDGLPLTMGNLYTSMRNHTTNPNGVGADLYNSRHVKVMQWLNQYIS